MKYECLVVKRVESYMLVDVEAESPRSARAKAINLARQREQDDQQEFCDTEVLGYGARCHAKAAT